MGAKPLGGGDATRSRANTRGQLIRTGRRLFYEVEFDAVTVDRIGRDADFTRAAFDLHFSGRDDLIAAIMLAEATKPEAVFRGFETRPAVVPRSPASFGRSVSQGGGDGCARFTSRRCRATPRAMRFAATAPG